jgi:hypothetical protein
MIPAPLGEVINSIAYATRPRAWKIGDMHERTRGLALSAGALHPISVLLTPVYEAGDLFRYDPAEHTLDWLRADATKIIALLGRASALLPDTNGTTIIFVADHARTAAHYDNAISLIWRDAGALLQTVGLVFHAYELEFCPLGLLGGEVVEALGSSDCLIPAGMAIVGRSHEDKR